MTRTSLSLALMALLAACGDGQPLFDEDPSDTGTGVGTDGGVPFEAVDPNDVDEPEDVLNSGTIAPPLRGTLAARGDVLRAEAFNENGGGATSSFAFNGNDDTFFVDGLAFDGLNVYQRFDALPQIGTVAVYQADQVVPDSLTGNPVGQIIPYFALFDTSDVIIDQGTEDADFRTTFAIVRTGGYDDFGFGTFAYARAGSFVIPTSGQATFNGDYAGARVSDTFPEFQLTEGNITIDIDFDDFNGTPGIKGLLNERRAFSPDGQELEVNRDIRTDAGSFAAIQLPDLPFVIRASGDTISSNGEIGGNVSNTIINRQGNIVEYETGTYVGIIAGDLTDINDGGEIVGILTFESEDSRFQGVIAQETGGFIATR